MKFSLKHVITLSLLSIVLFSCERNKDEVAGKGGSATLKVTPQHHGDDISNSKVKLKYNTQELPASFDEEVTTVQENGKPVATFTGLKKGNYYVYSTGYDSSIGQDVAGGIPYTIKEENTQNITVPVTEADHL